MNNIADILNDPDWQLTVEYDSNDGGDGPHLRVFGDTKSFRTLASLLTVMADSVDDQTQPTSASGWHFAVSDELPQLSLQNASLLVFNCSPIQADTDD